MENLFIWLGIAFCISQSAIFSGLNLAFFSLTRLRLEIEAEAEQSPRAAKILAMRKDSNFLLTTILWGNVGINVLLTLLTGSVMTGVASFMFSTVLITFFGEIIPQAYFSRNALRMASMLTPVLKFYQIILFPVAKPCALMLDAWLGKESVNFFTEENIKLFLAKHIDEIESEIDDVEGTGAINFLTLDEYMITEEGEEINLDSIISLPSNKDKVILPIINTSDYIDFIRLTNQSGEKWIIITDDRQEPKLVLDADGFIRDSLVNNSGKCGILEFCHIPVVIKDPSTNLGLLLKMLKTNVEKNSEGPIDLDVVLFWTERERRIITGADLFGRLLKGI